MDTAVVSEEASGQGIAKIKERAAARSLWFDAFLRLLRNRAAILGIFIISLNLIFAFFANQVAPWPYEKQILELHNSAPQWVINVFPSLEAKDEEITLRGAELSVETGDRVKAGALLGVSTLRGKTSDIRSRMNGTVIIEGNKLYITQEEVERYDISSGYELFVEHGDRVLPGDILAQHRESSEQYVAQVSKSASAAACQPRADGTRPKICEGTVYMSEGTLFVRNPNLGYVKVSNDFALGADSLGRDLFSRLLYGARISLAVAFIGSSVSLVVGVIFGLISGYLGGRVDNIMMRIVDILYAFPTILLIILLMVFFRTVFVSGNRAVSLQNALDETSTTIALDPEVHGEFRGVETIHINDEILRILEEDHIPGERFVITVERGVAGTVASAHPQSQNIKLDRPPSLSRLLFQLDNALGGMFFIAIGIGISSWMQMARLARGQVLSIREREYVEAARSLGAPTRRIMLRHIFPNILGPIIVAETLTIPSYILFEATLSFIGLGVNPPTPSWGGMISEGAAQLRSFPFQALFPALALFLIMFAFNFLGDGLRDALDPRLRGVD